MKPATAVTDAPSGLVSTIRDRNANACDVLRRRAQPPQDPPLLGAQHQWLKFRTWHAG